MHLVIHRRIVVALLLVATAAKLGAQPSAIILVRHAEKAATPASDPGLTPVGLQRAADLAAALGDAHVNAIVTTQLERAKATAKPLADAAKIVPTIVPTSSDLTAHVNAVVAAVAAGKPGDVVLVVGHSCAMRSTAASSRCTSGPTVPQASCGANSARPTRRTPTAARGL
jgi:broad specificity phosphatase PhoE